MVPWYRNVGRDIDSLRILPAVSSRSCDTSWPLRLGLATVGAVLLINLHCLLTQNRWPWHWPCGDTTWSRCDMLWHSFAIMDWVWHPLVQFCWSHYMLHGHRQAYRDLDSVRLLPGVTARCCDPWPLPIGFGIVWCCFVDSKALCFWYRNTCRGIGGFRIFPGVNARCCGNFWQFRTEFSAPFVSFSLIGFRCPFIRKRWTLNLPVWKCSLHVIQDVTLLRRERL